MEKMLSINIAGEKLEGRDAIYLNDITFDETQNIFLRVEIGLETNVKEFEFCFSEIIYFSAVELDFDERNVFESFAIVENSKKINNFQNRNHSSKLRSSHMHYYLRTYDTVFEIIANDFKFHILENN